MCGIIGIYSQEPVAAELYDGLIHLQHRGQDAAGVVTYDSVVNDAFHIKQGLGLVQEVFQPAHIAALKGRIGIGHTRYPTAGGYNLSDVQPLHTSVPRHFALAHNGNLTNYPDLAAPLTQSLTSSIDSEILLRLLAADLPESNTLHANSLHAFEMLCASTQNIMTKVQGSYSVVCLAQGLGLLAFRDPHGIRPLVLGQRLAHNGKTDYLIASESTMLYSLGFDLVGDIAAGEIIFIDLNGQIHRRLLNKSQFSPCIFEYVYFARPDSIINKVNVYRARLNMGQNLARHWRKHYPDVAPDLVIPVPFTSNTAALAFSKESGIPYSEGLYKNPFIGRTFIMPDGKKRSRGVRNKLTPQKMEIEGKKVLVLDDSLVRGTTSAEIVKMLREFGALEIYLVLACPPILHPCFYGIDMPSRKELIAANATLEEMRQQLGVDKLLYLTIEDLVEAVQRENQQGMASPCMACLNGQYITGKITAEKSETLEIQRQKDKMIA